jgi:hypothetical protein
VVYGLCILGQRQAREGNLMHARYNADAVTTTQSRIQAESDDALRRRIAWVASRLASAKLVSLAASSAWLKYFRAPFLSPSIYRISN